MIQLTSQFYFALSDVCFPTVSEASLEIFSTINFFYVV